MLEMSERESSDVWHNQQPAHKAWAELRRRSLEAFSRSRYTATVGCSQEVSQYSAEVDTSQARQGGLATLAEDQYWQNLDARGDACAAVRETERHVNQLLHSGAGDLPANNDHAVASITQ